MTKFGDKVPIMPAATWETMGDESSFDVPVLAHRYPNYLDLLSSEINRDDSMDAIIVPAAREVENIEAAARLAKSTDTLLITLCSHEATSGAMADKLDDMSVPKWWVIDIPQQGYEIPSIKLKSVTEIPEQTRRIRPSNLSDKRNVGVATGKMTGMRRIMFIDDDVIVTDQTFRDASLMLAGRKIVGLRCLGFDDKAVVDHAEAEVIRYHRDFKRLRYPGAGHISGNSVAVDPQTAGIFFPPEIYDEDLFAFYDTYAERSAALVKEGGYSQAIYDPFADPDRARTEEFGEILTHGLYQHLKRQLAVGLTDDTYWDGVIAQREWLIGYILRGLDAPQRRENFGYMTILPEFDPVQKTKVMNSLLAAQAVNATITGEMCVNYYRAWRTDQDGWRQYLARLPGSESMQNAIGRLGLSSYVTNVR